MKRNLVQLNKKMAKELLKKVLGVSGSALMKDKTGDGADIYRMAMGELNITVENDWFERNGLFVLTIGSTTQHMRLYFHPDTLEEDYEAEEAWKKKE